jgi:hypothetical protein
VRQIAKAGSKALILQGIEADQQAGDEVARLVSLAKTSGFETVDTWEAAREVDRVKREGAWEAEQAEAILDDGPDADLPLASEPVVASSEAFHVTTFERAIEMLRSVMTKSLSTFASANISSSDIEQITAFLQEVAKQIAQVQKARGAALAGGPETDERTLSPGDPKPGKHAGHPGPENVAQNPAPQEETDGERYIRLWHERERQYRDRVTKEAQELLDSQVRKRNQAAGWPCP